LYDGFIGGVSIMEVIVGRCLLNDKLAEVGMTQTQFAYKVGISRTQISDYANNRMIMSLKNALKISYALRCGVTDLYEWKIIGQAKE
jgi:DNA-binding XRE family transcriptional regulator